MARAPSGKVTFVFTDIEGSTRLFHELGAAYVGVLDRHNELLRLSWNAHHGYEVSTEGDSFFVAFESASDAVRACAEVQHRLTSEPWPESVEVRVRIGIHTGLASPHRDGYVALAVHQAARIMSAAHGGQVLISQDTVEALRQAGGFELRKLGRFRVRDFDQPQTLYQLAGSELGDSFPAVRAIPADGHNIPRRPSPTLGRDDLVAAVGDRVVAGGLITLLGPGGVGKTRVAEDVGLRVAPDWQDGVWLVNLAGIADSGLVPAAIADAVGAPAKPKQERWDDLIDQLRTRQAVIVLDNCEDLLDACRQRIESLRADCPGVGVLATSREPIRVPGEVLWHIDPLDVPAAGGDIANALVSPAVRLFAERAAAARPGFEVDEGNAGAVGEICRRLDGLPLSIELAAALIALESPAEILTGLDHRFEILRSRDSPPTDRHGSVEELLSWSYASLNDEQRRAFRHLSVFNSDFSIDTAAAAFGLGDEDSHSVAPLIWALVDRSLVQTELAADATRYRLLDTMRSYGRQVLDSAEEVAGVASRLSEYFLEELGPWMPPGRAWASEVAVELDNLRGLILLLPPDEQEAAQQIACTLGRYHNDARHTFRDGIEEITRYVELLSKPSPTRVSLLTTLAYLHLRIGDVDSAVKLVEDAEALQETNGIPEWDEVAVDRARGEIARRSGDLQGAVAVARAALQRPLTDRSRSRMQNLLGTTFGARGDLASAREAFQQELELYKVLGYDGYVSSALGNLAEVALRQGDFVAAARHQLACFEQALAQGSVTVTAFSMIVAARLSGQRGEWATAVELNAHGERLLAETGLVLYEDDRRQIEDFLEQARVALGQGAFDEAEGRGRDKQMTEILELTRSQLVRSGFESTE
jgi:predicted ATPase/class 3 adenylate cyclase